MGRFRNLAHIPRGLQFMGRSGNGFVALGARCALIAVIDAQRARRRPEGRCERRGRRGGHNADAGPLRAGFMSGARD